MGKGKKGRKGMNGSGVARRNASTVVWVAVLLSATCLPVPSALAVEGSCANEARRGEQSSAYLPNCRAYEQVTPLAKDSGEPKTFEFLVEGRTFEAIPGARAAVDGDRMAWVSQYPLPGLVGRSTTGEDYLSSRGSEGWSSEATVPPQSPENGLLCPQVEGIVGWSSDLTASILDEASYGPGCGHPEPALREADGTEIKEPKEPQNVQNLFVRDTKTRSYQLVDLTPSTEQPLFLAGSPELNHVVFEEKAARPDLYVWSEGQQPAVRLVTVLPDGTPVQGVLAGPRNVADYRHAVSADGSRIFFEAEGDLYVREHGEGPQSAIVSGSTAVDGRQCTEPERACTVELDASQEGSGSGGGKWLAAGEDGARVYFTDENRLTSASTAAAGAPDLYEYDFQAEAGRRLTDLTVDRVEPADVLGVSGASQDGSGVYFVADGVLPGSGANSENKAAQAGQPNLYVTREGTTAFIATLSAEDSCDWTSNPESECNPGGVFRGLTARVSGDGRYLAFNSVSRLTGYDNLGQREIYLYEAHGGLLACVSCNPSRAPYAGGAAIESSVQPDTNSESIEGYPQRNVSEAGQVFFETNEALLPLKDTNGLVDVYEYEHGALHLISGGTSSARSFFLDATPSGSDVFFATAEKLLPRDTEPTYDIYDAREGGGFPEPPASAPPCSSESCREAAVTVPTFATPGSFSLSGAGNVPTLPKPKTAAQIRAERLARTLKACRVRRGRHRRAVCESQARKRYGPSRAKKPASPNRRGK
jgi:hypothetical protein